MFKSVTQLLFNLLYFLFVFFHDFLVLRLIRVLFFSQFELVLFQSFDHFLDVFEFGFLRFQKSFVFVNFFEEFARFISFFLDFNFSSEGLIFLFQFSQSVFGSFVHFRLVVQFVAQILQFVVFFVQQLAHVAPILWTFDDLSILLEDRGVHFLHRRHVTHCDLIAKSSDFLNVFFLFLNEVTLHLLNQSVSLFKMFVFLVD